MVVRWSEQLTMFDLNASEFQGSSIFNGGRAGIVKNVELIIEKKSDESNNPDYKVIAKDALGSVNAGFYYPTNNENKTAAENEKWAKMQVSRVVHIAKAVMGAGYQFPAVSGAKQAYDVLFKLIADNSKGKKFNVYVTYGTTDKPSKYLGFRFFGFVEPAENEQTTLVPNAKDLLERVVEDSSSNTNAPVDPREAASKFVI